MVKLYTKIMSVVSLSLKASKQDAVSLAATAKADHTVAKELPVHTHIVALIHLKVEYVNYCSYHA